MERSLLHALETGDYDTTLRLLIQSHEHLNQSIISLLAKDSQAVSRAEFSRGVGLLSSLFIALASLVITKF